ncbi:MAG: ATP-binding cassette domain-containing protein [Alphaproteobacteria bacterium]|nr:ATP-binding cassette domain-containing protein [Alphaproteobacteria bacterium]
MTSLSAEALSVYASPPPRGQPVVVKASVTLRPGEFVVILGPNGAGKTSLLRGLLGLAPYTEGMARIGEDAAAALSPAARARRVAYLPQARPLAWPAPVRDVVALGRYAWGGRIGRLGAADRAAVECALQACDLHPLADRSCLTLSGGELARVHCARVLAAETPLIVADEPTAALDPRRAFQIMDLLRAYVAAGGGALVVVHDVALAARYADRLIWMKEGGIVADGPTSATLSAARLGDVYGVRAEVDGERVAFIEARQ